MTHVPLWQIPYREGGAEVWLGRVWQGMAGQGRVEWQAHETIIIINKLVLLHVRQTTQGAGEGCTLRHVGRAVCKRGMGGKGGKGTGCWVLMRAKINYEKCYEFSYN